MTAPERFEQDLPRLLAQLAPGTRPDYRDSLVETVERTPQRPAWTFPGRWLPVDITAQRVGPASAFRVPITLLLVAALLGVALFALAVASRPDLPAPFGPAQNGRIVYASAGDLYVLESEGAKPQLLLGGPEQDRDPDFSRQGDRLTFLREGATGTALYTIRPDGSDLTLVAGPLVGLDWPAWSADGSRIAFTQRPGGMPIVSVADTATGAIRDLDLAGQADQPLLWRPGHPDQLLYRGMTDDGHYRLGLVNVATGSVRPLDIPSEPGAPLHARLRARQLVARWAPAGRRGRQQRVDARRRALGLPQDRRRGGRRDGHRDPPVHPRSRARTTSTSARSRRTARASCSQARRGACSRRGSHRSTIRPQPSPSASRWTIRRAARAANGLWFGIMPVDEPGRDTHDDHHAQQHDRARTACSSAARMAPATVPLDMTTGGAVTWQRVAP